jgi:hypothetical protein
MRTLLPLFLLASVTASAQNIQLHRDFGHNRDFFTTTVEMFRPDDHGSTFFFIDFNHDVGDVKGVSESYFEIARVINLPCPLGSGLHVEYNGGHGQFTTEDGPNQAYTINDAWLVGPEWSWNAEDFSKGLSLQLLYKNIRDKNDDSFQVTVVWYLHLLEKKVTFNGFADFWKEDSDFNFDGNVDADYTFLSEPQLWYNLTPQFAVGSEVEFGHNFAGKEGWAVNPTLAVKYTF